MLYESSVVDAVCKFLIQERFSIEQRLNESQRGDDIIALAHDKSYRLYIEAKGESSSKESSKRYGKLFTNNQVKDHVAAAFYRAAKMMGNRSDSSGMQVQVGIALPKNQAHETMIYDIKEALILLNIEVFWVSLDGSLVEVEGFSNYFSVRPVSSEALKQDSEQIINE